MEEFQREMLGKMPGITEQAAAKAAAKMQSKFASEEAKRVKSAEKAAKQTAAMWDKALSGVFAGFTLKAIGETSRAVLGIRQELADLTNHLGDMSDATGVSVETLNGFRFAIEANGGQLSDLDSAFKALPKRLDDFRRGTGEAKVGLEELGFSSADADRLLGDADGAVREIVDRLQRVENPAQRAAAATAIFGESGVRLAQVVGDRSLEEWVDTADRFGADVGPAAVKAAQEWQQRTTLFLGVWTKFKGELIETFKVDDLVLNLGALFVGFAEGASTAIQRVIENAAWLATTIRHMLVGDMKGAQKAAHAFADSVKTTHRDIVDAATEGYTAFYDEALALRKTGEAAEGMRTDIERTSDETKKAADAAKRHADELAKTREEYLRFGDLMMKVNDDVISAEAKVRAEQRARWAEVHDLQERGVISESELGDAIIAINARANRDIIALRAERAEEERQFAEDSIALQTEIDATIRDMEAATFAWRAEQLTNYLAFASDTASRIADAWGDATDRELAKDRDALDKKKDRAAELRDALRDADDAATKSRLANRLADANSEVAAQKQIVAVRRMNAKNAARAQKAAALFGIGVNTAEAVLKAFALFGPPPSPPGIAAAGMATTTGLLQAGIVAATPLPSFYVGKAGHTTGNAGAGPGGTPALLHPREEVLTSDAADRIGRDKIAAWNAGADPSVGGGTGGDVYLDLEPVGRVVARSARRAGPLRDTLHGGRPIGARNPYGRN